MRPPIDRTRLITRIALFAALGYVTSLATFAFPNIKLLFFIIFSAGFLWGFVPGILVGVIGEGLWTFFNPYGPVGIVLSLAQVTGAALCGIAGALFYYLPWQTMSKTVLSIVLILTAVIVSLLFFLPMNLVDAWFFGPFWPRFIGGYLWAMISVVSNAIIFPLLFPAVRLLYDRECSHA